MMDEDRDYEALHGAPEFGPEVEVLEPEDAELAALCEKLEDEALSGDLFTLCPEL